MSNDFAAVMAFQTTILCSWSCNIVLYDYIFTLGGIMSLVWSTYVTSPTSIPIKAQGLF